VDLPPFAVTWDYRCPFARNAHEHLVVGLLDGADWDVTFTPFSLSQSHVPEGGEPVWGNPTAHPDLLALEAGVVVRKAFPDRFLEVHQALFSARHDDGDDLRERKVVRDVLEGAGVPADEVFNEIATGWPLDEVREAHERAVADHEVFGVPTFIVGDRAVFVRLMTRPAGDAALARRTIERVVGLLVEAPELNEFKYTKISN